MKRNLLLSAAIAGPLTIAACGGDETDNKKIDTPTTYSFESELTPGESSVSYGGQVRRNLLVAELKAYIGGLTDQSFTNPAAGEVVTALNYYIDFSDAGANNDTPINYSTGALASKQTTYGDLGGPNNLRGKLPETDADFQGGVIGYGDGTLAPGAALTDMFQKVEDLVIARSQGNIPKDPSGADIAKPYLSAEGIDYQQLIQKFLGGAIAYSQGTDDYLDDDKDGKGLLSDNIMAGKEGKPYTGLEHVWDEGFGYFGAARNFTDYSDDEIAGKGGRDDFQSVNDADGDGKIDFQSEVNFGHSVNAAKRDRAGAKNTDYTKDAFDAFLKGRTLIVNAEGNLTDAELTELKGYRDTAVGAWEKAISATVVHYVNDTLQDMGKFGTADYDFATHAKHWSELKGFAFALQFNVNHALITKAQLTDLHNKIGAAPVLDTADAAAITAYKTALNEAKDILKAAYSFDAAAMGDENGMGGW